MVQTKQEEYDFYKVERSIFRKNVKIDLPIYLVQDIRKFFEDIALKKGLEVETVLNKLIKKNIQSVNAIS
jgi:hypothetical protein